MSDLIDRQAVIDLLKQMRKDGDMVPWEGKAVFARIRKLPTIQPERNKGEWLPDNNNDYEMRFVCSCCKESEVVPTIGFTKYKPLWDFCPNCGADMRGEKDG